MPAYGLSSAPSATSVGYGYGTGATAPAVDNITPGFSDNFGTVPSAGSNMGYGPGGTSSAPVLIGGYPIQMRVSFSIPGQSWLRLRLVRSAYGPSVTADDGVVLLDDTYNNITNTGYTYAIGSNSAVPLYLSGVPTFQDTNLRGGRYYYYTVFIQQAAGSPSSSGTYSGTASSGQQAATTNVVWTNAGSCVGLAVADHGYNTYLMDRIPGEFRSDVGEVTGQPTSAPIIHFTNLLGFDLSRTRDQLDHLALLRDPDRVHGALLPSLVKMLGLPYEKELSQRQSRNLARNATYLNRRKGTARGVLGMASALTGYGSEILPYTNLMLDEQMASFENGGYAPWAITQGSATPSTTTTPAPPVPSSANVLSLNPTSNTLTLAHCFTPATNLLTAAQASFEDGSTGGWGTNGTLSAPTANTPTVATTGGSIGTATTYFYKVTATNSLGETTGSAEVTVTTACAAPVLGATIVSTTGGSLPAGTYYYKLTAVNAAGESTASNETSQAVTGTTSTIQNSWTAVTGATGYKLYRGTAAGAENQLVATITSGATTSYVDTGAATTAANVPTAATSSTTNAVTITWGASTGAGGYKVYRSTTAGGESTTPALVGTITSGTTTTFTDTGSAATAGAVPATNTTGTSLANSTAQAFAGTRSLAVTLPALLYAGASAPPVSVTVGTTYSASVYVYCSAATSLAVGAEWHGTGGAYLSVNFGPTVSVGAGWTRLTVSATAPSGALTLVPVVYTQASAPASGTVMYVDAAQVEVGPYPTLYTDSVRNSNQPATTYGIPLSTPTATNYSPVGAGLTYNFSAYVQGGGASAALSLDIFFHDKTGGIISQVTGTPTASPAGSWARPSTYATAPTGSVYASVYYRLTGLTSGTAVYLDAGQVEIGSSSSTYTQARLVNVHLIAPRINSIANPGFDNDTSSWTAFNAGTTLARNTTTTFNGGAGSCLVTPSGSTDPSVVNAGITLDPGQFFAVAAQINPTATTRKYYIQVVWYTSAGVVAGTSNSRMVSATAGRWTRVTDVLTVPSGATKADFRIRPDLSVVATPDAFYADDVLFEASTVVRSYFDPYTNPGDVYFDGPAGQTRCHLYPNSITMKNRILNYLPKFLPMNAPYGITLAMAPNVGTYAASYSDTY